MRTPYSLLLLWRERNRFLPAVLAVAFSGQLITLQVGLLIGTLSVLALPIDHSSADIWIASRDVRTLEMGTPIPKSWMSRIDLDPAVAQSEEYLFNFAYWQKPHGGAEVCCVVGFRLNETSIGALHDLTPDLRALLTEPGAVVVDEQELGRLGVTGVGGTAEVFGVQVRVVGLVRGFKSVGGPYVFCSLHTAQMLLPLFRERPDDTMYLLVRCRHAADVPGVVERLRRYADMSVYTREAFSEKTRMYWMTETKAGIGMTFTAMLALLVGVVVTSQTLYGAVAASLREYAVLRALGIPRWRMVALVLLQSFWVGVTGCVLAVPAIYGLGRAAEAGGATVYLPAWLLAGGAALTMFTALVSGLASLRSLRLVEPITLLR